MKREAKVTPLANGVRRTEVPEAAQTCEECGAALVEVKGDFWWGDQDGTHILCPQCGHDNFFPDEDFPDEEQP